MVFDADWIAVLGRKGTLPFVYMLQTLSALVSRAGSEAGAGLVDFSNDQDPMFGQFGVEVAVSECNED